MLTTRSISTILMLALLGYGSVVSARFVQPDPIGEEGGVNLYAYVNNDPLNAVDLEGTCPNCVVGAVAGVATGAAIAWLSGTSYSWRDALFDAGTGAIGAGLVSKANQLRRISELRSIAQSRGLQNVGQKGYTETWKDAAGGLERLQIKHQAGTAPGLQAGSQQPRFGYRIDAGKYWDPFTGRVGPGPKSALGHVPLEPLLPGTSAAVGGAAVFGRDVLFGSGTAYGNDFAVQGGK